MKRYLVFAFREYYPNGGMEDLYGHYDTIEEIKKAIETIIKEDNEERYNINVLDTMIIKYTDTYDMLNYFSEYDAFDLDTDELNNLVNELLSFDRLS